MHDIDIAYAAGFWEGEGSCGMRGRKKYNDAQQRWYKPQLRVEISQKYREPLDYIRESFSPGDTKHIYQDKYNKCFRYILSAKQARDFLLLIRPYVNSPYKQEQIDEALRGYEKITGHGGSCGI